MTVSVNYEIAGGGASSSSTGAGASGLAFGSDPTAVGAGGTPYTVTGLPWVVAYNGDGSVASYTIALSGGLSLVRTVSYTEGFPTFSGNIEECGAIVMTLPQLKALCDEVLIGLGVAAAGARFKIVGASDTDALAWSISTTGTKIYKPAWVEWDGEQIAPVSNVRRETRHTATHTGSTSISSAMRTLSLPEWLLGKTNKIISDHRNTAAGIAGTLRANQVVSGTGYSATDLAATTSSSADPVSMSSRVIITQLAAGSQVGTLAAMAAAGGFGGVSASTLLTINEAGGGNVSIDYCATLSNVSQTATLRHASIELVR